MSWLLPSSCFHTPFASPRISFLLAENSSRRCQSICTFLHFCLSHTSIPAIDALDSRRLRGRNAAAGVVLGVGNLQKCEGFSQNDPASLAEALLRVCRFDSDVEVNFWRVSVRTSTASSDSSAFHVCPHPKIADICFEKTGNETRRCGGIWWSVSKDAFMDRS